MDPISNADRLVMLLRQKLLERSKAAKAERGSRKDKATGIAPSEPSGVKALAAVDGADEHQLRRGFIQSLLADQLGPSLINDPQFQQIVSRVAETIEEDVDASRLLSRLVAELRAG